MSLNQLQILVLTPNQTGKQQSFQKEKNKEKKKTKKICCSAKLISPNLDLILTIQIIQMKNIMF